MRWLGVEPLEDRRLLAVMGGPEDDVASLPIPDYAMVAPPMDVAATDMAYVTPVSDPQLVSVDLEADPQLEDSGPLVNLDALRSDPRFAGVNGDGAGSSGPIGVAVVDTGIDTDHPYLNYAGGYDAFYHDPDPSDYRGHGTHVAGIVGSTHGAFTGVAPGVNLYGVKVFSDVSGGAPFYVIERGLQWVIDNAAANNIQVVNMSLGNGTNHQIGMSGPLDDEIAQLESMGVTVVSASGNDYVHHDPVPGQSYPGVNSTIGAGAVWSEDTGRGWGWSSGAVDYSTDEDRIVSFSQRDPNNPNHLMAPGAMITSTYLGGGFANMAGTSMASPHLAGMAALLQDAALEFGNALLSPSELVDVIRSTAVSINDGDDEHDNVLNTALDYLRMDAYAAVEAVYDMFADIDEEPFPTPLEPKAPAGSMIYDPPVEGRVNFVGDTDTFTIDVNAGQTVTVVAEGGEQLRPRVELYDPHGSQVASAEAAEVGGDALLQTVATDTAGTYQVVVSGVGQDGTPPMDASLTRTGVYAPRVLDYDFTNASLPGGDATLTVNAVADLDAPFEYLTLEAEGVFSTRLFESGGRQMSPAATTVTIPRSQLEALAADGTIEFTVRPSNAVNNLGQSSLTLGLSYPGISGGGTGNYQVGLVLNAAKEREEHGGVANATTDTAEDLASSFIPIARGADRGAVLGSLSTGQVEDGGLGRLYGYDANSDRVWEFDRDTGTRLGDFASPVLEGFGGDFGLATTPNSVLVGGRRSEPIVEIDPDTGTTLRTIPNPGINITGLAFLDGEIFALSDLPRRITVIDYDTGSVTRSFSSRAIQGLAASETSLYGTYFNQLYQIDPTTGSTDPPDRLTGSGFIEGVGIVGDELFVSNRFPDQILVYDLDTLALQRTMPLSPNVRLEALGADGAAAGPPTGADAEDVYAFDLESGQLATLVSSISSSKPITYSASQTQVDSLYYNRVLSFAFDEQVPEPAGPATLRVDAVGDLGFSSEYLTLEAEGIFSQQLFVDDGGELEPSTTTVSIPETTLAELAADGAIEFTVTPSVPVNNFGTSSLTLDLSFPGVPTGEVNVELLDADGAVLATGEAGAENVSQSITDFQAPADGTYYARVTGSGAVDYSLVVTRGATFELERSNTPNVSDLITNGSFETGNFSGWTVETTSTPFRPWQVTTGGTGGWGPAIAPTSPQDGQFVAWNGFDGAGPMEFVLYQDVTIPDSARSASLQWMHRLQWDFWWGRAATQPRELEVQVQDPTTGDALASVFAFSTGLPPYSEDADAASPYSGDTGWTTNTADLSNFAGQEVRIAFIEKIPELGTGPGQAEFDDISLMISEAEGVVSTTFDFEEFVPPPQLVSSLSTISDGITATVTHENGVPFDVERRFWTRYNAAFDYNSISAMNGQLGAADPGRFIIDFSEPLRHVSVDMGDFGGDRDDLQLLAFSGPGGTGQQLGADTGVLPASGTSQFVFDTLGVTAPGIQSIMMIGGFGAWPNSVFYDNLSITTLGSSGSDPQEIGPTGLVLGHVGGEDADQDEFAFTVGQGEQFSLSTVTPGDGPLAFGNELNPRVELVDPDGNVVASNDNGAADGRNARLVHTALIGGTYVARVLAAEDTRGEYVLRLNHAPAIDDDDLTLEDASIDENGWATLSGSFADPDVADRHTVRVDWGDGTVSSAVVDQQALAFVAEHQYLDDGTTPGGSPSHDYTISVVVTDAEQLADRAQTQITVNNVAPVITDFSSDATFDARAAEGDAVAFAAEFTDVGTRDTHTAVIDWGDGGDPEPVALDQQPGGGALAATHRYEVGGVYTATLTITDDDTGAASTTTTSVVVGAGINGGVLQIVGGDLDDHVTVHPVGKRALRVQSHLFREGNFRDFDAEPITAIQMWLGGGDDHATVAGHIDLPVSILGEEGDDHLQGGRGRAVLIGGLGADRLIGATVDSILIGGRTAYDHRDAALFELIRQWNRDEQYDQRVASLRDGATQLADDAPLQLLIGETVFHDQDADRLTGTAGTDWFFHALGEDKVTGQTKSEESN